LHVSAASTPRVAVFGAGAFGGWTALTLARAGARVTLFDPWGPGHVRASSGGETRVIRATYGSHAIYTRMAREALERWRAFEHDRGIPLLRQTGALWLFHDDRRFSGASLKALDAAGVRTAELTARDAARRFPVIDFSDVSSALFEPDAGYLMARRACEVVVDTLISCGGAYEARGAAIPARITNRGVPLTDGTTADADAFVFACGPWLPSLFPDLLGTDIDVTRQEVYYFGTPPGDVRYVDPDLPVWLDMGERVIYGIPGKADRGFKLADDTPGASIDPTVADRSPTASGIDSPRRFIAHRFPGLRDAPFIGAEVCQYESTPDANFIIDRHPDFPRTIIAGGGSGHGFKMGPVVGEFVSALVLEGAAVEPLFSLSRFARRPEDGWQPKWS
jgi:monomeric sarcosine oxidase